MNAQNEKVGNTVGSSMMLEKLNNIKNIAGRSICNIKIASKDLGIGGLYQVEDEYDKAVFLFITCNHLLATTSRKELHRAILQFEDIQQMKNVNLEKEDMKTVWTTKVFDATIIELSKQLASSFEAYGAHFLKINDCKLSEIAKQVAIVKHTFGKLRIEQGEIKETRGTDVYYRIGMALGSSGTPLLTMDSSALAIHNSGVSSATESISHQATAIHKATCLRAVVNVFLEERPQYKHDVTAYKEEISFLK